MVTWTAFAILAMFYELSDFRKNIAMFEDHSALMRREVNLVWDPPETDAAQETPIFGVPATSQMRAGQNFFEGFAEDTENLKLWS